MVWLYSYSSCKNNIHAYRFRGLCCPCATFIIMFELSAQYLSRTRILTSLLACVLPECKASGSGVPASQGRFPALRPNSVRRTSSSGSHSSSSSSSSGRGSMSPIGGYRCPISSPPVGLAGLSLSLSHPGVLEEDDLDQEQRNHHVLGKQQHSSAFRNPEYSIIRHYPLDMSSDYKPDFAKKLVNTENNNSYNVAML